MRFAFIFAQKAFYPVAVLCRVMAVTRQGFYAYVSRGVSARRRADRELGLRITTVFTESRGTFGVPRIRAALCRAGEHVGKRRVGRLMRAIGLAVREPRRFRVTTNADPKHTTVPNALARDFTATRPDERWVGDITYIATDEGWSYLAVLVDLYSRRVVGWALSNELSTSLALEALAMALEQRRPRPGTLMHHSDRGCQYTSAAYRSEFAAHGIDVSMSRRGNCWDNAVAESFFATLKKDLIARRRRWPSRLVLREAVFDYVHVFYNRQRTHSTLAYQTPVEVETAYLQQLAA